MNIGIDIDGVLTDLHSFMIEVGPEFFKRKPENIYGYDFTGMFNVDMNECNACWDKYLDYYLSIPPREGAVKVINELHNRGYKIYIITARVDELLEKTTKWLKDNNVYYDYFFNPGEDKSVCIKENNIDVMVEDSPTNIKDLSKYCKILAMKAKYNEHINRENVTYVDNWKEILDYFDML